MTIFCRLGFAAALIAGAAPLALAQQPLDMRTGLWEIASDRSSSGMPAMPAMPQLPPDILAKMPPAQRAQIEAAIRAQSGVKSGRKTTRVCITSESLRNGPDLGEMREANCKVNKNSRTARGWQIEQNCAQGPRRQTVSVRYDLANRETINGTVDVAMHDGGKTITMKQVMQGRWLSADCGNVRPLN